MTLNAAAQLHRCGAEAARVAHNHEVRCSIHLAGLYFLCRILQKSGRRDTDVKSILPLVKLTLTLTHSTTSPTWRSGMRMGLITPRSQDRHLSSVFYSFACALQKPAVKLDVKRSNLPPVWRSGSALLNSVFSFDDYSSDYWWLWITTQRP